MQLDSNSEKDLPVILKVSFHSVYESIKPYASDEFKEHPYHLTAKKVESEIKKHPFLIDGFSDTTLIERHREIIDILLAPLFPDILQLNEIKAAMVPFSFESFKLSKRFQNIINNAGDDFELKIRNFDSDIMYRRICAIILKLKYGYDIDVSRPFYFDIPNSKTSIVHHYRVGFNGDFTEFIATEKAPVITDEDYKELLDNFENIALWKEKFPPNSYILKGFGLMNLFDVTTDQTIASISSELLSAGEDLSDRIESKMRDFFRINDLRIGFSVYDVSSNNIYKSTVKKHESFIINNQETLSCNGFFCDYITDNIFVKNKTIAISDVENYGKGTHQNGFYKQLKKHNIGSLIIVPFRDTKADDLILIEIVSPRPYELNTTNQSKLVDVLPIFRTAIERSNIENKNAIEAIIQEKYTSIHPSVKWKFNEAAEKYQKQLVSGVDNLKIDEIVFKDAYPLYGQLDIKGSSIERDAAIQEDLITQLSLAIAVLKVACKTEMMPIYNELMFRIEAYLSEVKKELQSGDETSILSFLKREIYPVFKHVKKINTTLAELVNAYTNRLDDSLQVVYEKRKAYEQSVTLINDSLSSYIDKKQKEAQTMFPHYFERYKTDGVEYNMYIGQSLVKDRVFNNVYLNNLRLWQLQLMCEMENVAMKASETMLHELRVASLILVHSSPLAIKFRMDEKQFDVDGAYNIRYEIIKKRIDKACIKGTKDRITIPGKIAIVYSHESDALEYKKYIKFLQSKNKVGVLEEFELEEVQGVAGLKALRVSVIYDENFNEKSTITFNELVQGFY